MTGSMRSRRGVLAGAAGLAAAAVAPRAWALSPLACMATPKAMEGPYYFDPGMERADIAEDRPGVPLRLSIKVVDAPTCAPIAGARVDAWHCDGIGFYSGYDRQGDGRDVSARGRSFLRGTQFADREGGLAFATIYPGWYAGRTTHIHLKVFLDRRTLLTTQIYFPDDVNERVYRANAPYRDRKAVRETFNGNDGLFRRAGEEAVAVVTQERDGYRALFTIGVARG
ncbi:MAG: intradiol ring-cleavage dioxygenase [Rhodospirillales bacterium]